MLAKTMDDVWAAGEQPSPLPDIDYNGFPYWVGLGVTEPNREQKSADWLKDKLNIHVYWPNFVVQRQYRNRPRAAQFKSVIPGILLAPAEFMEIDRREAILDWARLRVVRLARLITRAEVEIIRGIEARLNICRCEKTHYLRIGDRVRFIEPVKAAFLGEGSIIKIASGQRIGIQLDVKLIGTDKMFATAAELEVM